MVAVRKKIHACIRGGIKALQARKGRKKKKADLKSMNMNKVNDVLITDEN